jgi:pyocin large subunit-like protein
MERMMKLLIIPGVAAWVALALCACQGRSSAVAPKAATAAGFALSSGSDSPGGDQGRVGDPRDLPTPLIDGKPMWAANSKHTAEENAEYQFSKNGGDFAAHSESEYVAKAHAFIEKPPRDVEILDRANGDKLEYDAKDNTFVVVARNGAPRTMFKPRDGAAYWALQKDREGKRTGGGQDRGSDQG